MSAEYEAAMNARFDVIKRDPWNDLEQGGIFFLFSEEQIRASKEYIDKINKKLKEHEEIITHNMRMTWQNVF